MPSPGTTAIRLLAILWEYTEILSQRHGPAKMVFCSCERPYIRDEGYIVEGWRDDNRFRKGVSSSVSRASGVYLFPLAVRRTKDRLRSRTTTSLPPNRS